MRAESWRPTAGARVCSLVAVAAIAGACGDDRPAERPAGTGTVTASFAGSIACAACHTEQFERWQASHHAMAMLEANEDTVQGDFDDATFEFFAVRSRFFRRDGAFWVETDDDNGNLREFKVRYTFGVTPLQQYLIEFPDGRLQALTIAWDSRPVGEGGQRWFHLYPDEFIGHDDRLHWTGRDQNWNYMCAECHSTGLDKNYELASDTFDTRWFEINVGCEACHGPGSRHIELAGSDPGPESGLVVNLDDAGSAAWIMNPESGIAERSELLMRPPAQPEACGRCHARRSVIASEYDHGLPLLDTHRLSLLEENLYYPDGQIRDEVYVYGSFLQSKMYRAGVTCSNCHDPHSGGLKATGAASDVCAQCHAPSTFGNRSHHGHASGEVQCVDCHMPSRDYMVIDGRRDHSFRVPRPDLTLTTGAPNACADCHEREGAAWADRAISEWSGNTRPTHFAPALQAGRSGAVEANRLLSEVATDNAHPGIARATALTLMRAPHTIATRDAVRDGLSDGDALVRMAALAALGAFPTELQIEWAGPLLADPVRAVRIAAFDRLSPLRQALPASLSERLRDAEREFVDSQLAIAERPEALGNLANLFVEKGDQERALQYFRLSLDREPRNFGIRVNAADLYRQMRRDDQAEALLREGLEFDEGQAALRHALGLSLVRTRQRDAALAELRLAAELDPQNPRFAYVYAIALNSLGRPDDAVDELRAAGARFPADFDIAWTLVTLLRDEGREAEARQAADDLLARFPDSREANSLRQSLR